MAGVRKSVWPLAAAVLVLLAGCRPAAKPASPPATVPVGASVQTITAGGLARTFRVYRPAALPSGVPVALVVMLHGGFGSAEQAETSYGWDAEAQAQHFLVAYPDGVNKAWNVGG